jgi:hypothetical protein
MTMKTLASLAGTILVAVLGYTSLAPGDDGTPNAENVVEVTARGLELEAPDEIPSGWTTFQLKNESAMIHFAVLERLPDGIGIAEQQAEVAPVFQKGMDLLKAGNADAAMEAFGGLPAWFGEIVFWGGPGLIAPERIAQTTVLLKPGTYLLECYVKTGGIFHSYNPNPDAYGMVHEITVTEETTEASAPEADVEITISSERGIEVGGDVEPGDQTIAVHFADQTTHEHFLGHDVHLVRLDEGTDVEALASWMDWTQPAGLETAAPATFIGGLHEMPAGETGYFTAALEPGRYAWIAEVPNPAEKGMLQPFTVGGYDVGRVDRTGAKDAAGKAAGQTVASETPDGH